MLFWFVFCIILVCLLTLILTITIIVVNFRNYFGAQDLLRNPFLTQQTAADPPTTPFPRQECQTPSPQAAA